MRKRQIRDEHTTGQLNLTGGDECISHGCVLVFSEAAIFQFGLA